MASMTGNSGLALTGWIYNLAVLVGTPAYGRQLIGQPMT